MNFSPRLQVQISSSYLRCGPNAISNKLGICLSCTGTLRCLQEMHFFFFFSSELYQNLFVIAVCISTWSKFITTLSFFVCVCRWRPSMWPRLNFPYPAKTFSTKILAQNQTHCVFCCRMWEMTSGLRYATLDWNKLFELWDLMGFSAGVVSSWYWLFFFFPPFCFSICEL